MVATLRKKVGTSKRSRPFNEEEEKVKDWDGQELHVA